MIWQANQKDDMNRAAVALQAGQLVAFPTETVYGLGADGLNTQACQAIYEAKGRPSDNPLILHIADLAMLEDICQNIPDRAYVLAEAFWPGPLTLILEKTSLVSEVVSGGLDTVAVRMPNHPVALELIRKVGRPLAAPSANLSGRPSPTTATHVAIDLEDRIAGILDGGPCEVGLESTIVDLTVDPPAILRPGGISAEALEKVLGLVNTGQALDPDQAPKAPGMKYRHYAPSVPVYLLDEGRLAEEVDEVLKGQGDKQIGFLLSDELIGALPVVNAGIYLYNLGSHKQPDLAAQRLFSGLRYLDLQEVDVMYAEPWEEKGIGVAIMNRMHKLALSYEEGNTCM